MKLTFEQKLRFGFWLLAVIPVVVGALAFYHAFEGAKDARRVAATNELVKQLEKLLSELKYVAVAQREFILTGDERHLIEITESRRTFDEGVDTLRRLKAEPHWLELLLTAGPQKFEEVQRTVELRRAEGPEAAAELLLANPGQQAMDSVRRIINNMIQDEERALRTQTAAQQRRFRITLTLFGAVVVLNLVLISAVAYRVRGERHRIQALNVELERRVAARTEALQRSNEDLQQFAYIASHDLKEPMRMIASYSAMLQRRYQGKLDEDADTYIGFIVDGVKRMNQLISDLLEYSRATQEDLEALAEVDPAAVLKSVLSNLEMTVAEARAEVRVGTLPSITYDPLRLSQIFQNLVGNAIKYRSDRRPVVEISATDGPDETLFAVKDNGIGIEAQHRESVFGIFKRLHGKEYEGTGIGLAMVKKIVERFGGRIWVESTPGSGSTFYFSVPKRQHAAAQATTS